MKLFEIILYCNFFFPIFYLILGTKGAGLLSIILIILSIGYIIKLKKKNYDNIIYIFILLIINYLLSPLFNINSTFKDYLQVYRPILFLLAYLIGRNIKISDYKFIEKSLEKIYIINLFISTVYIYMPKVYNIAAIFYTKKSNVDTIRRLTSTFPNPYDYAYYLNFMIIFYIIKYKKNKNIKNLILSILGIISLFYTYSRTGIIILIVNIIIFYFLELGVKIKYKKKLDIKFNSYLLSLGLGFISIFVIYENKILYFLRNKFSYIYYGINSLFFKGISKTRSLSVRFDQYTYVEEALEHNLFLGLGPYELKQIYTESMYSLYLFRYGLLGFIYVIFILFLSIFYSLKNIKKCYNNTFLYSLVMAFSVISITNIISFITNNYIDQIRNNFLYYVMLGFILKLNRAKISNNINKGAK